MIIESEFGENYEEQRSLEKQVSGQFGYKVSNEGLEISKNMSVLRSSIPKINTRINPLIVKKRLVQPNDRLRQLDIQMKHLQLQKRISEMADKDDSASLNIIDMLNQKIKDYNYIIDHKHITDIKEDPEIEERIKGKQTIPQTQLMAQNIKNKNQQFHRYCGSLSNYELKSKEITQLYREFSKKIIENPIPQQKANCRSRLLQKLKLKQNQYNNQQNEICKLKIHRSMACSPQSSRQPINIKQPYVSERYLNTGRQLQKQSKHNRASLQVWRHRIQLSGIRKGRVSQLSYQREGESKMEIQMNASKEIHDLQTRVPSELKTYRNDVQEQNNQQKDKKFKQIILSQHLKKKNGKYFRTPGNKFLSKFDSTTLAKSMLKGISPNKQKIQTLPEGLKKMYNRKLKIPEDISENDKYIMKLMIEDEDDMFYWTASRNQKINLLLKGKKHS